MKTLLFIILVIVSFNSRAQNLNPGYDSTLAKKLGADAYGMKKYVLVILKTGPVTIDDKAKTDSIFKGHLKNIGRLAKEGKLSVAGPLGKNTNNYRGIFIFNVSEIKEAEALVQTDPAIISGILGAEYFNWYGSAALPVYLETHPKIQKTNILE